jgi:D-alanine-D-alanine ligase-like ATP-grasp enzyme
MGLRFCGVDLMIAGDISQAPRKGGYWIIEINSAPGLDHYATIGKAQQRIVEDLYLEVLKAMDTDA